MLNQHKGKVNNEKKKINEGKIRASHPQVGSWMDDKHEKFDRLTLRPALKTKLNEGNVKGGEMKTFKHNNKRILENEFLFYCRPPEMWFSLCYYFIYMCV